MSDDTRSSRCQWTDKTGPKSAAFEISDDGSVSFEIESFDHPAVTLTRDDLDELLGLLGAPIARAGGVLGRKECGFPPCKNETFADSRWCLEHKPDDP